MTRLQLVLLRKLLYMRKKLLLLSFFAINSIFAQDYRYTNNLFTTVNKTADVVYDTAPFLSGALSLNESTTTIQDLIMDIYQPNGDTFTDRPAIVFVHAGGYINGHRNHEDMVAACDSLAKKGYVTATIDYRKGFYLVDDVPMHSTRAVYRGVQDGRSAIRFLRANAATYGIDADKVYMVGSSAGGFTALHAAYMNDIAEKPVEAGPVNYTTVWIPYSGPDLGAYDRGNNLMFNGQPDAIVSMWGAIQSADVVKANDVIPALLIHGKADGTVPFDVGKPFGFFAMPDVHGSKPVNDKLDLLGFTNKEIFFVDGEDHEFHGTDNGDWPGTPSVYWEPIMNKSTTFLWKQHKPIVGFSETITGMDVNFSDTSTGALSWLWNFGDGNTSTQQSPNHTYATVGNFDVKLYVENDILSWDETTKTISTTVLSIADVDAIDFNVYPNPTNGIINIKSDATINRVIVYSLLGNEILNTTNVNEINISHLASGMYILKVFNADKVGVKRIIKN